MPDSDDVDHALIDSVAQQIAGGAEGDRQILIVGQLLRRFADTRIGFDRRHRRLDDFDRPLRGLAIVREDELPQALEVGNRRRQPDYPRFGPSVSFSPPQVSSHSMTASWGTLWPV